MPHPRSGQPSATGLELYDDTGLASQTEGMIVPGSAWEMAYIRPSGAVSDARTTRTGVELSRDGAIKTIDHKTIVQASPRYRVVEQAVAANQGWEAP